MTDTSRKRNAIWAQGYEEGYQEGRQHRSWDSRSILLGYLLGAFFICLAFFLQPPEGTCPEPQHLIPTESIDISP